MEGTWWKRGRCQDRERSGGNPLRRTKKRTEPTDADSALCLTYYLFFSANPQRKSFAVAAVGMASLLDHLLLGSEARLVANLLQRLLNLLH